MATITLDWLHIIALLGAVQALMLAGALAVRRRNRTANRVLAVAMLGFAIYLAMAVYYGAGMLRVFPHFFGVSYPLPFLFGPLIYLYAVSAGDRDRRLRRWDALHFVPFVVAVAAMLPVYSLSGPDKLAFYEALQRGERPVIMHVLDMLKLLSGITYAAFTLLFVRRHRARIKDNYSSLAHIDLHWVVMVAAGTAAIWVLAAVLKVTQLSHSLPYQRGDDLITLAMAMLVCGMGYLALRQPEIFRFDTAADPAVEGQPATPAASSADSEEGGSRYERSGLSEREAAALKRSLLSAMDQDRPWQNSDLTLADLARLLSTTPHKLSEVLNSQLERSFYDFVNDYRVRHVQRRIGGDEARHFTILSLALDAGFASKSTFNDVFKKHTGKTPSAYRRSVAV